MHQTSRKGPKIQGKGTEIFGMDLTDICNYADRVVSVANDARCWCGE